MSSDRFLELLRVSPQGIIQIDADGIIQYINPSGCSILGGETNHLHGTKLADIFSIDQQHRVESLLQVSRSQPASGETLIHNNRALRLHARAADDQSTIYIFVDDVTDQTLKTEELRRDNRSLEQNRRELERSNSALQLVHKVITEIEYPHVFGNVLEKILRTLPAVVESNATAALTETEGEFQLRICLKSDAGEWLISNIKSRMIDYYTRTTGKSIDPSALAMEISNCPVAGAGPVLASITGELFVPLRLEVATGVIGSFSASGQPYSEMDERLSIFFVDETLHAVSGAKNLMDAERKKLVAMVESMVDGVLMTDENDHVVIMNQAARKILRVSRREDSITKKYFQDTLGFYPFRLTKGLIHKAGLQATIKEEIKVFDKTLHSVVAPVYDTEGKQTGTVVVLRDITEQKETEERKNDFLSVISHELRTPLASIGGSIDLVLENVVGEINDKQRRYLELAKDSCQKLNIVIDDLLDISKFEKGKMEIRMESISIVQLVEEVAEKFQPYAMEKEIILKLEKPSQDIRIYGDYNRLVQVLNNLLSNAIKFTPSHGEVEIRLFQPKVLSPHVGVSVRDTGPGIRVEDLERVFDKFEQVRRSDTRKIGGTGLGLAISRSIIEAHRGKIWAESKLGEGARFIFLLPVEKRIVMPSEIYAELQQPTPNEELHALIIATDAENGYLLKGILLERGLRVTLTYNPQDGFALITQKKPNLILIDLDVDPSSGTQLIDILSHDPETATIPIISFSRVEQHRLVPFQNVTHVAKPIEINRFLQALASSVSNIKGGSRKKTLLLVDDDPNLRMICRESLEFQNYQVIEARDGNEALDRLRHQRPDLILLDIMLPGMDGFELAQIIKSNISTSHIPIIFLTAKGQTEDKVRALRSGATDYLVKPFDSTELAARIETILERTENELAASPTTKLPGSVSIEREINHLISQHLKFALCYLDLDNLKAYNDQYGYAKADGVVKQTGDIIRETVLRMGHPTDFVGHIAGDDFVFITQPELADHICLSIIEQFDRIIPYFYKVEDRERGFIEAQDRFGVMRQFPVLSISIVCITNEQQELQDHLQIATMAADYKRIAKAIPGSTYVRNGKAVPLPGRGVE